MLLTISTTHRPATDLGFLLHKHPDRAQQASLSFGTAHVFYPEANDERCTAALLLEVDPVALVRAAGARKPGRSTSTSTTGPTSRPRSSASRCRGPSARRSAGAARTGPTWRRRTCRWRPGSSRCPAAAASDILRRLFEPLGYAVAAEPLPLDPDPPRVGRPAACTP